MLHQQSIFQAWVFAFPSHFAHQDLLEPTKDSVPAARSVGHTAVTGQAPPGVTNPINRFSAGIFLFLILCIKEQEQRTTHAASMWANKTSGYY